MVRKLLLAAGSLLVLVGAMLVYQRLSSAKLPSAGGRVTPPGQVEEPTGRYGNVDISPGRETKVYLVNATGRREGVYEVEKWEKVGSEFVLTQPRIQLYPRGGQTVYISAERGTIVAEEIGQSLNPRSGTLEGGVRIAIDRNSLPESRKAPREQRSGEFIFIDVDNLQFDNELLALESNGPVEVRSAEMDIDADDLRLSWNDNPRELRSLKLMRGRQMRIHDGLGEFNAALAGREGKAQTVSASTTQASEPAEPGRLHRLRIEGDVRVDGTDQRMENADWIELVFEMARQSSETLRTPATADSAAVTDELSPQTIASTSPAENSPQPVTITWTGPLVLTPVQGEVDALGPGEYEFRAFGEELTLIEPRAVARCQSLELRSDEEVVSLAAGGGKLVDLQTADGEQVCSESLVLNRRVGQASGQGRGWMVTRQAGRFGAAPQPDSAPAIGPAEQSVKIVWTEGVAVDYGVLAAADGSSADTQFIRKAVFRGDVRIDQGDGGQMQADSITSIFREPKTADDAVNQIERVQAEGGVKLKTGDSGDYVQADRLEADMAVGADGRPYPARAVATGHVAARQGFNEIQGGRLEVAFAESTPQEVADGQRAVQATGLTVTGGVVLVDVRPEQALRAEGDKLISNVKARSAVLSGKPARVFRKGSRIEGAEIHFDETDQMVTVPGAGELDFVPDPADPAADKSRSRPMHLTWGDRMVYEGATDRITIDGRVAMDSLTEHFQCKNGMVVQLEPAEADSAAATATTQSSGDEFPADLAGRQMRLKLITADGEVLVTSMKYDAEGLLEQRLRVTGEQLIYDARTEQINVLGAGTLLADDYRPPEPGTVRAAAPGDLMGGQSLPRPSQTLFQFAQGLQYDLAQRRGRFWGGVDMVHRSGDHVLPPGLPVPAVGKLNAGRIVRLTCGELTAVFGPPETGEAAVAAETDAMAGFRVGPLEELDAREKVNLEDGDGQAIGERLTYVRRNDLVVIHGDAEGRNGHLATLSLKDPSRRASQLWSGLQITWNLRDNRVVVLQPRGSGRR